MKAAARHGIERAARDRNPPPLSISLCSIPGRAGRNPRDPQELTAEHSAIGSSNDHRSLWQFPFSRAPSSRRHCPDRRCRDDSGNADRRSRSVEPSQGAACASRELCHDRRGCSRRRRARLADGGEIVPRTGPARTKDVCDCQSRYALEPLSPCARNSADPRWSSRDAHAVRPQSARFPSRACPESRDGRFRFPARA